MQEECKKKKAKICSHLLLLFGLVLFHPSLSSSLWSPSLRVQPVQAEDLKTLVFTWASTTRDDGTRVRWIDDDVPSQQPLDVVLALAFSHFNDRRSDIIPALGENGVAEDCPHNLKISAFVDTVGSAKTTIQSFLNLRENTDAIVGPQRSAEASPLSIIASTEDIPVVSYWATSAQLAAQAGDFANFARTIPSDGAVAIAMADLFVRQGYERVSMLYVGDAFGVAWKDSLFEACSERGISLSFFAYSFEAVDEGDLQSLQTALSNIKSLQQNIIVVIYLQNEITEIASVAQDLGMLTNEKLWIFNFLEDAIGDVIETDEAVAKMMNGSLQIRGTMLGDGDTSLNPRWGKFLQDWENNEQYRNAINEVLEPIFEPTDLNYTIPSGYFDAETRDLLFAVAAFEYDAVMSYGLAVCANSSKDSPLPQGRELFDNLLNLDFEGISGRIKYDLLTGNRALETLFFAMTNYRLNPDVTNPKPNDIVGVSVGTFGVVEGWDIDESKLLFASGTSTFPSPFVAPAHNKNLLPTSSLAFAYALVAILMAAALLSAIWCLINWRKRVIINTQREFLLLMIVGTLVSGSSIIPLTFDEGTVEDGEVEVSCVVGDGTKNEGNRTENEELSQICMAFPWLYCMGFMLVFSSLFIKSYRISKIFNNRKLKKDVGISTRRMQLIIFGAMLLEACILILWTFIAPLEWKREAVFCDGNDMPVESRGSCEASNDGGVFLGILAFLHLIVLGVGVGIARTIRRVPSDFQEGKWLAHALIANLQLFVLAIPTLIASLDNPTARLIVLSLVVFVSNFVTLLCMVLPKVSALREGKTAALSSESETATRLMTSSPKTGRMLATPTQVSMREPSSRKSSPNKSGDGQKNVPNIGNNNDNNNNSGSNSNGNGNGNGNRNRKNAPSNSNNIQSGTNDKNTEDEEQKEQKEQAEPAEQAGEVNPNQTDNANESGDLNAQKELKRTSDSAVSLT